MQGRRGHLFRRCRLRRGVAWTQQAQQLAQPTAVVEKGTASSMELTVELWLQRASPRTAKGVADGDFRRKAEWQKSFRGGRRIQRAKGTPAAAQPPMARVYRLRNAPVWAEILSWVDAKTQTSRAVPPTARYAMTAAVSPPRVVLQETLTMTIVPGAQQKEPTGRGVRKKSRTPRAFPFWAMTNGGRARSGSTSSTDRRHRSPLRERCLARVWFRPTVAPQALAMGRKS